jgi:hypothetical protein
MKFGSFFLTLVLLPADLYVIDAANIATHICNSIIMVVDFCVLAHPIRWHQLPFTLGLAVFYSVFTVVYHWGGGTNKDGKPYIYSSLYWADPPKALVLVAELLVGVLVIQILICGFQRVWFRGHRKWASSKINTMEI